MDFICLTTCRSAASGGLDRTLCLDLRAARRLQRLVSRRVRHGGFLLQVWRDVGRYPLKFNGGQRYSHPECHPRLPGRRRRHITAEQDAAKADLAQTSRKPLELGLGSAPVGDGRDVKVDIARPSITRSDGFRKRANGVIDVTRTTTREMRDLDDDVRRSGENLFQEYDAVRSAVALVRNPQVDHDRQSMLIGRAEDPT
jgi:hypothetical protein